MQITTPNNTVRNPAIRIIFIARFNPSHSTVSGVANGKMMIIAPIKLVIAPADIKIAYSDKERNQNVKTITGKIKGSTMMRTKNNRPYSMNFPLKSRNSCS